MGDLIFNKGKDLCLQLRSIKLIDMATCYIYKQVFPHTWITPKVW